MALKPLLLLAGASVLTTVAVLPTAKNKARVPAPQQRMEVSRYYNDTCAKCHGENAQGGGGGTPSLIDRDKFDQKWDRPFFDAIKKGVPDKGMEAFDTLSDEAIWAQVNYIRELQAKGLRAKFGDPSPDASGVYKSQRAQFKIETVVNTGKGLRVPWAIDWLPDGKMLVTNRPGFLMVFDGDKTYRVEGLPPSQEMSQGGLMEVAVHPDYAKNGWIYLAINDPKSGRKAMTKIVRGKLSISGGSATWSQTQAIYTCPDESYSGSGIHFGCRIVFDGKGHIFFAIGSRGSEDLAQKIDHINGKICRVNEDGSIPKDNPFANRPAPANVIWSYGHRNPQGLVMDAFGRLWETEHAPRGGDELNLIEKGGDYGWNTISFGINYNGSPLNLPWPKPGQNFKMPILRWMPSIAACGLDVCRGAAFPEWKGDLLAGGLAGKTVDRVRVGRDGKLIEHEELIHNLGRVRDVSVAKDGKIYVALNEPDKIICLSPVR